MSNSWLKPCTSMSSLLSSCFIVSLCNLPADNTLQQTAKTSSRPTTRRCQEWPLYTFESVPAHLATVSIASRCHRARQHSRYLLPVRPCGSYRTTHRRRASWNRVITRQSSNSSRVTTRLLQSISRLSQSHLEWLVFVVGGRSVGKTNCDRRQLKFWPPTKRLQLTTWAESCECFRRVKKFLF